MTEPGALSPRHRGGSARAAEGRSPGTHADAPSSDAPARTVRRRPKNRRAQIAAESAAAFGAHGYHGVSMDDIARRLDISSTALYRHFPSKYALFRAELLRLSGLALRAVELPEEAAGWTPRQRLEHVLAAIVAATIANRPTAALARWERRYLEPEDLRAFSDQFAAAIASLRARIGEVRPELDGHDRAVRAVSIYAVISSIGDHHATVPAKTLAALLGSLSWAVVDADLSGPRTAPRVRRTAGRAPLFKHELLLHRAVELFHERGYPNVSVEDIAAAAELSSAGPSSPTTCASAGSTPTPTPSTSTS
ncbi:TetR family transcriptional regulator, partial [Streptomyces sp. NPDC004980]